MPVTFQIPSALREFAGGQATVEIASSPMVLKDALEELWVRYPGVRDRVTTEQGVLRQHINIFVGNENIRFTGGVTTPLPPECVISIVPAISGGSVMRPRLGTGHGLTQI